MREINEHVLNPANEKLKIVIDDAPGAGNANHRYNIAGFDTVSNASREDDEPERHVTILFQNGTIPEMGVNGITEASLLAIVADRLRSFQAGPFSCKQNACALTHIEEAMHWLQQRTIDRMRRGVEGKHVV